MLCYVGLCQCWESCREERGKRYDRSPVCSAALEDCCSKSCTAACAGICATALHFASAAASARSTADDAQLGSAAATIGFWSSRSRLFDRSSMFTSGAATGDRSQDLPTVTSAMEPITARLTHANIVWSTVPPISPSVFNVTVSGVLGCSGLKVRCGYECVLPSSPVIVIRGAEGVTITVSFRSPSSSTVTASLAANSARSFASICASACASASICAFICSYST